MTNFGIIMRKKREERKEKKKKCNINFIRLKRGGTVVSARISAKESKGRIGRGDILDKQGQEDHWLVETGWSKKRGYLINLINSI